MTKKEKDLIRKAINRLCDDDGWEVCNLWHDEKHEIRLSIHKECDHRQTYCAKCGESVKFVRKPIEETK